MAVTMVIEARFPLGLFLGHRPDGSRAPLPDTARLHAALTNAAGQGSTAWLDGAELRPSKEAIGALRWLEEHPPRSIQIPDSVPVAKASGGRPARSWRDEGVMEGMARPWSRKVLKAQSDAQALAGPVGWGWSEVVPDGVREVLDLLCGDVSCLGESDSPVVLELVDPARWVATHELDEAVTSFPEPGGLKVRTPVAGRFDELEDDYRRANPGKRPSVASDRHAWSAQPSSKRPSNGQVRERIYRDVDAGAAEVPWPHVITIPIHPEDPTKPVKAEHSLAWSVALHRALATRMGDAAPAVITGRYARATVPPNRVALQLVPVDPKRTDGATLMTLVVMLPPEMEPVELATLQRAMTGLTRVYCKIGGRPTAARLGEPAVLSGDGFWKPPEPGVLRFWRPMLALVPEVRHQRGAGWSLDSAVALSVSHLLRDRFAPLVVEGTSRYQQMATLARDHGVRTYETRLLRTSDVSKYVHKVPKDLVVQPLTGLVDMGPLVTPGALFSLGQSRHLGGGLMVPEDIAEAYAEARGLVR